MLDHVFNPQAPTDAKTLQVTADSAFKRIRLWGPSGFDLEELKAEQVNGEHLTMMLRCISSWKRLLPGWSHALDVAKEALVREGKDPKDALFGMF